MLIGFSTGSLAFGDFRLGLKMISGRHTSAVELSALREEELLPLIEALDSLDLRQFSYIALHAPSRLHQLTEQRVVSLLQPVAARGWPIIIHPDVITNFQMWGQLGQFLCLENMDKRKTLGRTAKELASLFAKLPAARLCFDIGHARQIDPTMCEAEMILRQFASRIQQIHLSLVNSGSVHEPLNFESTLAYRRVAHLIPRTVPIILETPVRQDQLESELAKVDEIMQCAV